MENYSKEMDSMILGTKFIRKYFLFEMAIEPLFILISYLNVVFADTLNEHISFTYVYFFDKIVVICVGFLIVYLTRKYTKGTLFYFIGLSLTVFILELFSLMRNKIYAYFICFMIYSTVNHISLLTEISIKIITISNTAFVLYIFAHLIFDHFRDITFPLMQSLVVYLHFISMMIPYMMSLKGYSLLRCNLRCLANDFKSLIEFIPTTLVIYEACNQSILLKTKQTEVNYTTSEIIDIINFSGILNYSASYCMSNEVQFYKHKDKVLHIRAKELKATEFGKSPYVIMFDDITSLMHKSEMIASENAKWLFINTTNHQIKTPLSGIESSLLLLENCAKHLNSTQALEYVNVALLSATNLRHIVDDSTLLFEEKQKSIALHNEVMKIDEITGNLYSLFGFETYSKNVKFEIQASPTQCGFLIGDKKRITHILYTLLSNAFKYTTNGVVRLSYTVESVKDSCNVAFSVSDTGIGMTEQEKASLYQAFTNAESNRNISKASNGLGLFVIKILVELMNGKIAFTSKLNCGTTFTFTIPLSKAGSKAELLINTKKSFIATNELKILVVDDNVTNIYVLKSMLKRLNLGCDEAHNGLEAVNMNKLHKYTLVFMDINMPIMNGFEAASQIKMQCSDSVDGTVIIGVSAQEVDVVNATEKFDYFLPKPISFEKLTTCLETYGVNKQISKL